MTITGWTIKETIGMGIINIGAIRGVYLDLTGPQLITLLALKLGCRVGWLQNNTVTVVRNSGYEDLIELDQNYHYWPSIDIIRKVLS